MLKANIDIKNGEIEKFCKKWGIKEFSIFGSALRDDFKPESDIDIVIDFDENKVYSLSECIQMESELKVIFNHKVDLIWKRSIVNSENYIRRKHILDSVEVLYVA
jgi:uncharacterized protein